MIRTYPLNYMKDGEAILPSDTQIHDLAIKFAETELAERPNFRDYQRVWLQCAVEKDQPIRGVGMLAVNIWETRAQDRPVYCADIPLIRFVAGSDPEQLIDRCNSFLADYGLRGTTVTIFISRREAVDQRCPNWKDWLKAFDAHPADRWVAKVK